MNDLLAAETADGVTIWLIRKWGEWTFGPVIGEAWTDLWDDWQPISGWTGAGHVI